MEWRGRNEGEGRGGNGKEERASHTATALGLATPRASSGGSAGKLTIFQLKSDTLVKISPFPAPSPINFVQRQNGGADLSCSAVHNRCKPSPITEV